MVGGVRGGASKDAPAPNMGSPAWPITFCTLVTGGGGCGVAHASGPLRASSTPSRPRGRPLPRRRHGQTAGGDPPAGGSGRTSFGGLHPPSGSSASHAAVGQATHTHPHQGSFVNWVQEQEKKARARAGVHAHDDVQVVGRRGEGVLPLTPATCSTVMAPRAAPVLGPPRSAGAAARPPPPGRPGRAATALSTLGRGVAAPPSPPPPLWPPRRPTATLHRRLRPTAAIKVAIRYSAKGNTC